MKAYEYEYDTILLYDELHKKTSFKEVKGYTDLYRSMFNFEIWEIGESNKSTIIDYLTDDLTFILTDPAGTEVGEEDLEFATRLAEAIIAIKKGSLDFAKHIINEIIEKKYFDMDGEENFFQEPNENAKKMLNIMSKGQMNYYIDIYGLNN